jgi:two-component system CheB/CheR fusion protein
MMVTTGHMGKRILLVEDHADTANVFARMLRRDGYDVSIATSCAQATRMCDQSTFDLLICDINLPDGDGAQVLTAARKTRPETVGIIVSGHEGQAELARARQVGFSHTFLKPIDYPSFRNAISQALGQASSDS